MQSAEGCGIFTGYRLCRRPLYIWFPDSIDFRWNPFIRILMDSDGFWRIPDSIYTDFDGFHLYSTDFGGFHWFSMDFDGFHWFSIDFRRILMDSTDFRRILMESIDFRWILMDSIDFRWILVLEGGVSNRSGPWNLHGISMESPWNLHGISIASPSHLHRCRIRLDPLYITRCSDLGAWILQGSRDGGFGYWSCFFVLAGHPARSTPEGVGGFTDFFSWSCCAWILLLRSRTALRSRAVLLWLILVRPEWVLLGP